MNPEKIVIVSTTIPDMKKAEPLAHAVIENRLAACVQMSPVTSIYRWHGEVEKSDEILLTMKTLEKRANALSTFIRNNHPYETPEIITTPTIASDNDYRRWATLETDGPT